MQSGGNYNASEYYFESANALQKKNNYQSHRLLSFFKRYRKLYKPTGTNRTMIIYFYLLLYTSQYWKLSCRVPKYKISNETIYILSNLKRNKF